MRVLSRLMIAGLLAALSVPAQSQNLLRGVRVQGEISPSTSTGGLMVELSAGENGIRQTAQVNPDGTFQFDSATPGTHELRITGTGGAIIHQEFVTITGPTQQLSIRLPESPNANRAAGDTISLQQLTHKVPAKARKFFEKGQAAEHKGKKAEAEALLRQAIGEDPEFADAHNELGAVLASEGRLPEAAAEFQKTIDLAPEHRLALPNLCIVLAKMRNFHDAAQVARRAMKVAPQLPEVRFILGVSIVAENGDRAEALANLRQAENSFPKAHLLEAELLAKSGNTKEAEEHLEDYLRVAKPDDAQRVKVQADLDHLRQQNTASRTAPSKE